MEQILTIMVSGITVIAVILCIVLIINIYKDEEQ